MKNEIDFKYLNAKKPHLTCGRQVRTVILRLILNF